MEDFEKLKTFIDEDPFRNALQVHIIEIMTQVQVTKLNPINYRLCNNGLGCCTGDFTCTLTTPRVGIFCWTCFLTMQSI